MKLFGVCVGVLWLLLITSCGQPDKQLMTSLKNSWTTIEPWAVAGVEGDASLNEDQKTNRKDLISEFGETILKGYENAVER